MIWSPSSSGHGMRSSTSPSSRWYVLGFSSPLCGGGGADAEDEKLFRATAAPSANVGCCHSELFRTTCLRGPLNFERLPSSVASLAPAFSSHELPAWSTAAPRHLCRSTTVGLYRPHGLRPSVSFHCYADLEAVSSVRCPAPSACRSACSVGVAVIFRVPLLFSLSFT